MPLYEYQCDECAHRFELIQKFSDPPAETCPACGGAVTKLLSSPAIQFKGSGWYITDYARAGKPEGTSSEAKTADKAEKADGSANTSAGEGQSKSDATPAPKPAGTSKTDSKPTASAPSSD